MMIDPNTGTLLLPNGLSVGPSTQRRDLGELSWHDTKSRAFEFCHYSVLDGGQLDQNPVAVSICFKGDRLESSTITIDVNEVKDELGHFDSWAEIKVYHDNLLCHDLGVPHARSHEDTGSDHPGLQEHLHYSFTWGSVTSTYDYGGGDAYIRMSYGISTSPSSSEGHLTRE